MYWDEHGFERTCAILELVTGDDQVQRLTVIDGETGMPVLDPVEALPVASHEGGTVD